jgi:hypothetical protein
MKINFERSGGLAGINDSIVLDTLSMPPNEAKHVEQLIDSSNFFNLPSRSPQPKAGSADYFHYKITVQAEDQREHKIQTNDITIPQELEPLINFLQQKVQSGKKMF